MDFKTTRIYPSLYPKVNELVMVKISEVSDYGATCSLLEYGCIEARMSSNHYSNKRIRSVKNIINTNNIMVLEVIMVDSDKGYIDLSKKYVNKEEENLTREKYKRNKFVHNILIALSIKDTTIDLADLYNNICWPLNKIYEQDYYSSFEQIYKDPTILNQLKIKDNIKEELINIIDIKFKPIVAKIGTEIQVTCFGKDGIEAVKTSLMEGKRMSNDKFELNMIIVSCPVYSISIKTDEYEEAIEYLNQVNQVIEQKITSYECGSFKIIEIPKLL